MHNLDVTEVSRPKAPNIWSEIAISEQCLPSKCRFPKLYCYVVHGQIPNIFLHVVTSSAVQHQVLVRNEGVQQARQRPRYSLGL